MTHPSVEELLARMRTARQAGTANKASPEQLRLLRELARDCPAFTPNLLELARLLRLTDEPEADTEEALAEIQHLLEQSVQASARSAPALLELAHFMDTFRNAPGEAEKLFEESVSSALSALENSWSGLMDFWLTERTPESLAKAQKLGELAERIFPESPRLVNLLEELRERVAQRERG